MLLLSLCAECAGLAPAGVPTFFQSYPSMDMSMLGAPLLHIPDVWLDGKVEMTYLVDHRWVSAGLCRVYTSVNLKHKVGFVPVVEDGG